MGLSESHTFEETRNVLDLEGLFVQYPRAAVYRPLCSNIAAFDGKPQRASGYTHQTCGLREIQPAFRGLLPRIVAADLMIEAQRCNQCPSPVIASRAVSSFLCKRPSVFLFESFFAPVKQPVAGAVGMWESRVFCEIPKELWKA